jgi:hypothetical protein
MKRMMLMVGATALALAGCAHDRHYVRYHDRYYVSEEHPADRVYVREYDSSRASPDYQNNMEPRTRGKHAESLGWNTENYYLQRGY